MFAFSTRFFHKPRAKSDYEQGAFAMKQSVLTGACSATLGALIALAVYHAGPLGSAWAQQPLPDQPQRLIEPPAPRAVLPSLRVPVEPGASEPSPPLARRPAPEELPTFRVPASPLPAPSEEFTPEEQTNIAVYEKCNRSAVHITTRSVVPERFFFLDAQVAEGAGSGAVLDQNGNILTNNHVIDGAGEIRVALYNGDMFPATLVGKDPVNDIAVLRIAAPPDVLHPIEFGDSERLRVGQKVYAIGNPFGLERTLTTGIVSSLNRQLPSQGQRTMKSIIQIDAALNRGNSGGPLLDSRGRYIGMNTAIASQTGENTGVGFAIPANTIKRVVPQLLEHGHVIRPDIGITRVFQTEQGLLIVTTAAGGPAERAGLQGFRLVRKENRRGPFVFSETHIDPDSADRIVAIDGQKCLTGDELLSLVEAKKPGDTVLVTIVRQGREMQVPVVLGAGE
jgi:S1-C subfamily serine protease